MFGRVASSIVQDAFCVAALHFDRERVKGLVYAGKIGAEWNQSMSGEPS